MKTISLPVILAASAGVFALVFGLPPLEKWLLYQPSCFAYVGMAPSRDPEPKRAFRAVGSDLAEIRDRAIADGAIRRPAGRYVSIVRQSYYNQYERVAVATERNGGWVVNEAVLEFDDQLLQRKFKALPVRALDPRSSAELDKLLRQPCGFPEPSFVPVRPKVWLELDLTPYYDHPEMRLIELHAYEKNYSVVRGAPVGISGRILMLLRTPDP